MKALAFARRNRWAISFADLALLLLGFFVLLQASSSRKEEIVGEIAREFGAQGFASDVLSAKALFQPGEAMLSEAGKAQISAIAAKHRTGTIELHSIGQDRGADRYDRWDLAAARVGALARALAGEGVDPRRIVIRGLDQSQGGDAGQRFTLRYRAG